MCNTSERSYPLTEPLRLVKLIPASARTQQADISGRRMTPDGILEPLNVIERIWPRPWCDRFCALCARSSSTRRSFPSPHCPKRCRIDSCCKRMPQSTISRWNCSLLYRLALIGVVQRALSLPRRKTAINDQLFRPSYRRSLTNKLDRLDLEPATESSSPHAPSPAS